MQNSARVRPADLRSLREFAADYPECTPVLLYRGEDRLKIAEVLCVPVEQFLEALLPGQGLVADDPKTAAAGGASEDLFRQKLITVLTKLHRLLSEIRLKFNNNV